MRRAPNTHVLLEAEAVVDKVYDLSPWDMPLMRRKAGRAIASLCWRPESPLQVFMEISEGGRVVGIGAAEELQLIKAVATTGFEVEPELVLESVE